MAYGDVIDLYAAACRSAGYDENTSLDDPDYTPASEAHKSFYLTGSGKSDSETHSGNTEWMRLGMELVVMYLYPVGLSIAASEKANWNLFDALERALWAVAATNGHAMQVDGVTVERAGDYKVFRMDFSAGYNRPLAV